jgi:hypothetical protein
MLLCRIPISSSQNASASVRGELDRAEKQAKVRFVTDFSSHVATATVSRKKTVLNSVEQCPDGSLWLLSQSLWWPSLQYFIWFLMALPVVLFLKSNWQAKNKAKI